MTKLVYLTDSYKKIHRTKIVSVVKKSSHHEVILNETIFYPQSGGQLSDRGEITGKKGRFEVTHVRMQQGVAVHEGKLAGELKVGELVNLAIDWKLRWENMRRHSAGHVLHEIVMETVRGLTPIKGEHGREAYIEYRGAINVKLAETLEKRANMLIAANRPLRIELVTLEVLQKRASRLPPHLPKNKQLRILQIEGYPPIPDGGTQVKTTGEIGPIKVTFIEQLGETVRLHYQISEEPDRDLSVIPVQSYLRRQAGIHPQEKRIPGQAGDDKLNQYMTLNSFKSLLIESQNKLLRELSIQIMSADELEKLYLKYLGTNGETTKIVKNLKNLPQGDRKQAGLLVNEILDGIKVAFKQQRQIPNIKDEWFDTSLPGLRPPCGHLHIVTQAISEITRIFERIGFTRVRHPEVDWDWYPFESLNMPPRHPARDEWETFFVESSKFKVQSSKFSKIVLTPHTSNGQVREMEKGELPIRMINIAKCYRRQSDVSHVPMFHQFEGLYVDKNVSIGDLKGVMDHFFREYYGRERKSRLRPFHFQFTEPSFEVDINCGVCLGRGCKLCKEGWLELGGAGMVHPVVLRNGGINPDLYNGFAFGWGVERVAMMKSGTQLDDIRLLYNNDLRFLEQF